MINIICFKPRIIYSLQALVYPQLDKRLDGADYEGRVQNPDRWRVFSSYFEGNIKDIRCHGDVRESDYHEPAERSVRSI